jgi:hypothetical protein
VPPEFEAEHFEYIALMRACWSTDAVDRPSFAEVVDTLAKIPQSMAFGEKAVLAHASVPTNHLAALPQPLRTSDSCDDSSLNTQSGNHSTLTPCLLSEASEASNRSNIYE